MPSYMEMSRQTLQQMGQKASEEPEIARISTESGGITVGVSEIAGKTLQESENDHSPSM